MILNHWLRNTLAAAIVVSSAAAAQADEFDRSTLSLSFTNPTGTALATDNIEVMLTFALSAGATEAFTFDASAASFGVPGLLPTQGSRYDPATSAWVASDFAEYTSAHLGTWYGCSTNFSDNTCPGATTTYSFEWETLPQSLTLAPGESFTYRMGTFIPKNGLAPAGTYTFTYASLALFVQGTDADGEFISADVDLAWTHDVDFVRTVTAVPEPGSWALLMAGLMAVGGLVRRRLAD